MNPTHPIESSRARPRPLGILAALVLALGAAGCPSSDDDDDDDVSLPPSTVDAGPPAPTCGNLICEGAEATTCATDCQVCGNQVCEGNEPTTCASDCAAPPATLVVRNNSSTTIYRLYVARCEETTWGANRLGTNLLYSNYMLTLTNVTPGCYDMRAEASSSETYWQRTSVALQSNATFTWTLTN